MDTVTAAVVGAFVGGVLTVIGGLLATLWLARLERNREIERQRRRHATAVRIVAFEMQSNGASLVGLARGVKTHPISTAAYLSVARDLYSLLPEPLASDVSFAYTIATFDVEPASAQEFLIRVMSILSALREYGQKQLGLDLPITGPASASTWFRNDPNATKG